MRMPAEQFLTLRAFGAPPIVIAIAAQGTFRGFKDTKTPLYAVGKYYKLNSSHTKNSFDLILQPNLCLLCYFACLDQYISLALSTFQHLLSA